MVTDGESWINHDTPIDKGGVKFDMLTFGDLLPRMSFARVILVGVGDHKQFFFWGGINQAGIGTLKLTGGVSASKIHPHGKLPPKHQKGHGLTGNKNDKNGPPLPEVGFPCF